MSIQRSRTEPLNEIEAARAGIPWASVSSRARAAKWAAHAQQPPQSRDKFADLAGDAPSQDDAATPDYMDADAILGLSDYEFQNAWSALSSEAQSAIGARGFERFRRLTAYINESAGRAEREQRGHEQREQQEQQAQADEKKHNGKSASSEVIYSRVSDIKAQPIRWLWQGRIARGKVTMIAGHPGLGKSQITTSAAAIVTRGGRWPVDRTSCEIGSVIILSAEDDAADTIRPRLEASGADLSRVHVIEAVRDGFNADGDELRRSFSLKLDIRRLEAVLAEIGDVVLIVIDPISAYLGGTDSHNNADVRALLAPLSDMAARHRVAIVAVSHLNKGGAGVGGDALLRVTGSLAFVAAARAAYIVAKDPEDEKRRLFVPAKNNIAADIGGLAYRIEGESLAGGIETSKVVWEAEPVTVSADELMRVPTDPEERTEIEEASDWLRSALSDGAVEAKELFRLGAAQGFNERAMQRARKRIGASTQREGFGKGSKVLWQMPPEAPIGDNETIGDSQQRQSPMDGSVAYGEKTARQKPSTCPKCGGEGCSWCKPEVPL